MSDIIYTVGEGTEIDVDSAAGDLGRIRQMLAAFARTGVSNETWQDVQGMLSDIDHIVELLRLLARKVELADRSHLHPWLRNEYQFPRLLSEIVACGAFEGEAGGHAWRELKESMDLEDDDLNELFDRAQHAWEQVKKEVIG